MSMDQIPLLDEEDILALMHRDVHFGGNFKVMINYYENENHIGIIEEFTLDRLKDLAKIEEHFQEDIFKKLELNRLCCRRHLLGHIDLIDKI